MTGPQERYELKFIFDEAKFTQAMCWLNSDTSFRHSFPIRKVNSLYFDDVSYQSVRDNLAGISRRKKTRLRWYGNTETGNIDGLVLERKIKNGRLGHKELFPLKNTKDIRTINVSDMTSFIEANLDDSGKTFPLFNDYLFPTLLVEYSRQYFEDNQGIRLTIDESIQFRNPTPSASVLDGNVAAYPFYIMEIKFPVNMKNTVSKLLKHLHFTPKRHSKYLTGLSSFGIASYI